MHPTPEQYGKHGVDEGLYLAEAVGFDDRIEFQGYEPDQQASQEENARCWDTQKTASHHRLRHAQVMIIDTGLCAKSLLTFKHFCCNSRLSAWRLAGGGTAHRFSPLSPNRILTRARYASGLSTIWRVPLCIMRSAMSHAYVTTFAGAPAVPVPVHTVRTGVLWGQRRSMWHA